MQVVSWTLLFCSAVYCSADRFDDIGYTRLVEELGDLLPTGSSVTAVQVEADVGDSSSQQPSVLYLPDTSNPEFAGKTFADGSGIGTGVSGHANDVAFNFFGNNNSTTPGINAVFGYLSGDWLDDFLHTGSPFQPEVSPGEVMNFSWIGGFSNNSDDVYNTNALARLDLAIERDKFTAVVGLNNGSENSHPDIMVSGYNSISVGLTNGGHSRGLTLIAGSGRMKPEIVAPSGATSFATPIVSSVAALLRDQANALTAENATRPEVIKAVLLAGATKEEFPAWTQTPTKPLDAIYGAGELNVYNSYKIMAAGEQPAYSESSGPVGEDGWDFRGVSSTVQNQRYFIDVPPKKILKDLSVLLTWHRNVSVNRFTTSSSLVDLGLRFHEANNFTLGTQIQVCNSPVDNVEHIYIPGPLVSGQYVIVVEGPGSGSFDTPYAVAWRSSIQYVDTFELWKYFALTDPSLDQEDLDPSGDPDLDGIINLIEYAAGLDPLLYDESGSFVSYRLSEINNELFLTLTFKRRRQNRDLTYEVGVSSNLIDWGYSETGVSEVEAIVVDEEFETVTVRSNRAVSASENAFMRLRITKI